MTACYPPPDGPRCHPRRDRAGPLRAPITLSTRSAGADPSKAPTTTSTPTAPAISRQERARVRCRGAIEADHHSSRRPDAPSQKPPRDPLPHLLLPLPYDGGDRGRLAPVLCFLLLG